MRSLSQFQALQDGEKKLASLRELGLTDTEIQLWQSRDASEAADKVKPTGDTEFTDFSVCGVFFPVFLIQTHPGNIGIKCQLIPHALPHCMLEIVRPN